MDTQKIIVEIDVEIARLQQIRSVLSSLMSKQKSGPGRPPKGMGEATTQKRKRHKLRIAARAKIAATQKARWAKQKAAKKT